MSDILDKNKIKVVEDIKDKLSDYIGSKVTINYNLGRNKHETYEVVIKKLYKHIFIVEFELNSSTETKSFSYADIITRTIRIEY